MIFGRIDAINIVDLEMRLKRMELDLVDGQADQSARRCSAARKYRAAS